MKRCSKCKETKVEAAFGKNRVTKDGLSCYCKLCTRILTKEQWAKNPVPRRNSEAHIAKWQATHPENLRAASRKYNGTEKALNRKARYNAKVYSIPEPTRPMPPACEACGSFHMDIKRLARDHDHFSGAFRGWLCSNCNFALGMLKDDPARIAGLASYLKRTTEW